MVKQTLQLGVLLSLFINTAIADNVSINDIDKEAKLLSIKAKNLDPAVIKLGLVAYHKARMQGLVSKSVLTIVDYDKPSTEPRFCVFDLQSHQLLFQELVAHGKNSGDDIPHSFSNKPHSLQSSLGVFVTGPTYIGQHGYSLRLNGLEKGFNEKAATRDIVIHAAAYVSQSFAQLNGRLGHSWGCFALNPRVARPVIDTIKNGTLIFAYHHDTAWLKHSQFLS